MKSYQNQVAEAAAFIHDQCTQPPEVGILTGTGLGGSVNSVEVSTTISYNDIPHFPETTVISHLGQLNLGRLHQKPVLAMQGRFHLYEGYAPKQVVFPIRVMQQLGIKTVIISNASGGLNPHYRPGDIMVIADHINLTGQNPLIGPNIDYWGERFVDMHKAYDSNLADLALKTGLKNNLRVVKGVYAGLLGPSLETPAEVRYLQTIGADAVGFSTVMEVIAAVQAGMRVLGLSIVTNVHDPQNPAPAVVKEIIAVANKAALGLDVLINRINAQM
jgi:purine-nucleoside phosphorylase